MSEKSYHVPVMLFPAIDSLEIKKDGIYVDSTAGGGGHSSEILKRLGSDGKLIMIDRDPDAIAVLKERFSSNQNVFIVHDNYKNIKSILKDLNIDKVDGILADLGVSSHQIDSAGRGFSYHLDSDLDMRMSKEGFSAKDAVNGLPYDELKRILYDYGEERYAPQISRAVVEKRKEKPIETTFELDDIISSAVPAKYKRQGHPARKTFQALRIYVNGELDDLKDAVYDMFSCLNIGGILSIITFHSLEDRIVKTAFKDFTTGCTCPPDYPVCVCGRKQRAVYNVKSEGPFKDEIEKNYRCHSARLRSVRRIDETIDFSKNKYKNISK